MKQQTQKREYSFGIKANRSMFRKGMVDGIPIAMGYLAVSFSLGILAKKAGLGPFESFLASILNNASAGEYAAFSLIMVQASYLEVAIMTFIANARYLLMSVALSQKIKPEASICHRLVVAFDVTDEIFALSVSQPGYLNPNYTYGIITVMGFWNHAWLPGGKHSSGKNCECPQCCPLWHVSGNYYSACEKRSHCFGVDYPLLCLQLSVWYITRNLCDIKWNKNHHSYRYHSRGGSAFIPASGRTGGEGT